jgi:uncharacterized protein (TIGR03437 family)
MVRAILWGSIAAAGLLVPTLCRGQSYTISTVAGTSVNTDSGDGGPATKAAICMPYGVAVDSSGNVYIAEGDAGANTCGNRIRKIAPDGTISTIAGGSGPGSSGDGGKASAAQVNDPRSLAVDSAGNLYIADYGNNSVRKISTSGIITTVATGGAEAVAVDGAGNVYIADGELHVRKLTPAGSLTNFAGSGVGWDFTPGPMGDGGPATSAMFGATQGVAVDGSGNVYITDAEAQKVRKVAPNGIISTVAGNGTNITGAFSGDGGPATSAALYTPKGLAVNAAGNLYIADNQNNRVRVVGANGIINTIAGNGNSFYSGDGGPAASAAVGGPYGLAINGNNIYVAALGDISIRLLSGPPAAAGPPSISSGGVISALQFGGFTSIAPGSWIEIYGSNLAADARSWATSDFHGANAPTSLDGTSVTIAGLPAVIDYISPGQVNVQAPSNIATGLQPIVVTTAGGASPPYSITVNATQPGLLAPSSFSIGGMQYAAALFSDGATFVLPPSAIAGVTSRRAKPGDAITLYGVGFGPVTPGAPAGQIVQQSNMLVTSIQILFGSTAGALSYGGLAPGFVGLYQFNVTVPNIAPSDSVPLTFLLGGAKGSQTLYLAVGN